MKSYFLKLTSAVAIDGDIVRAGALIEVSEAEAKNLLHRGKAVLATAEDGVEQHEDENDGEDLSKWNKTALLEYAKAQGVEVSDGMTKAQIIEAIAAKKEAE